MCCLFGLIDYGRTLTPKQKNHLLAVLSTFCEARGTDATGIAYHSHSRLCIYKRPIPAHQMHFRIPRDAWVVMGHTRLTTQGSEQRNYNNHPFLGTATNGLFALAHNGVIRNDVLLRKYLALPSPKIETDSYIGVQLLERSHILNFDSLRKMAEQLEGSFTFTVLSGADDLYIIKGDNPMCLYHFPSRGLYLYASTEEILRQAIRYLRFQIGEAVKLPIQCGEILQVAANGHITREQFDDSRLFSLYLNPHWQRSYTPWKKQPIVTADSCYWDDLKSVAPAFGYTPDDIDALAAEGFSPEELEEFLYCGEI